MNQTLGTIESMPPRESVARGNVERIDRHKGESGNLTLRARLIELETDHLRLQRLVAELLVKNQKLRELLCEQAGTSAAAASLCRGDGMKREHASSH